MVLKKKAEAKTQTKEKIKKAAAVKKPEPAKAAKKVAVKKPAKAQTTGKKAAAGAVKLVKEVIHKPNVGVVEAKHVAEIKPVAQPAVIPVPIAKEEIKKPEAMPIVTKAPIAQKPVALHRAPIVEKTKPQSEPTPIVAPIAVEVSPAPQKPEAKVIELDLPVALKDLAFSIQEKPAVLIKKLLIEHKILANLNQDLGEELARKIAAEYGCQIKRKPTEEELLFSPHEASDPAKLKPRSPIVTFMGHVDHGKTSLLDAIRKSKVAENEYGGITQHIGAYEVVLPRGKITFLDTPGHEAFTAMRARGAKVTDIVVLVVAADDGVMPQTVEAADHAKEAGVPIIVAMNKIDKPQVNLDKVKKQLSEMGLMPEDWGGKTITVGVSAKTGQGIDDLLEMILLEAEMLELKADPAKLASGIVLDAKISEGRGTVATLLVEDGTLHTQDTIIVGPFCAKVRAMQNEFFKHIAQAGPSKPVEVLGLPGLPEAGEQFFAVSDEKKAKEIAGKRKDALREKELRPIKMMSLEDLSSQIKEGKIKELKLILKADVGGSLEAIAESFKKFDVSSEVKLNIIHQAIGSINLSDVILAEASGAIILGFHVNSDERSKEESDKSGVDIRTYNVIYELINDLKGALEGMLAPKVKKIFMGRLVIRQVFKLSKGGTVAGCYVEKGKIIRAAKISVSRNGEAVFEGSVHALKRFKDDVREVTEGMECGVSLTGFDAIMQDDILEAYTEEKIARKL